MNKRITWLLLALLLVSIAVACAPAAAPTPQVLKETVVVPQTVVVRQTVVVPQTVQVPAPTTAPVPAAAPAPVTLKVYDPTGAIEVTQLFAPRLADLNGKTICEVSDVSWEAARTFTQIRQLLQKQFPTAKFVTWDQFPSGNPEADDAKLGDLAKAKGCQAAIVGNAG